MPAPTQQLNTDYFPYLDNQRYEVASILETSPRFQAQARGMRDCYHPLAHGFTNRPASYCNGGICPPCARVKARFRSRSLLDTLSSAQSKTDKGLNYWFGTFTMLDTSVEGLQAGAHDLRSGIRQLMSGGYYPGWSMAIETTLNNQGLYNQHAHLMFLTVGYGGRNHRSQGAWANEWQAVVPNARSTNIQHLKSGDEVEQAAQYTIKTSAWDLFHDLQKELTEPERFLAKCEQLKGEKLHPTSGLLTLVSAGVERSNSAHLSMVT
jgi:hypothetical protein